MRKFVSLPACAWLKPGISAIGPVGGEVSEMRVHFGPGYRLYFTRRGALLIVMLAGGDKSTPQRDIKRAHRIAAELGVQP